MAESKKVRREQAKVARHRELRRRARQRAARRFGIALAAAVIVGLLGLAVYRGGSGGGVAFAGDLRVGGTLKSLSLPSLEGNGTVSYDQFRNKPLVLNFFASWCPYCVGEMPGFQQVYQQLGSRVAFIGVSQSDSRSASISLAHKTGVRYPTAIDSQGTFFHAIGSSGMPTTLFIEPGGRIAYIQVGPLDPTTLKQFIGRYLGVSA